MKKDPRHEIDEYADTIYAMVGFANLYRFDNKTRSMRPGVQVLQGWRFACTKRVEITALNSKKTSKTKKAVQQSHGKSKLKEHIVTPDIAVLTPEGMAVVGEVKRSFPKDSVRWAEYFKQLSNYDAELSGWPCHDGTVDQHDIVLLVHQSRGRRVKQYFLEEANLKFEKPFSIIEFNRSSEANEHFFFRTEYGALSDSKINRRLTDDGIPVPMRALVGEYSTIKLYDAEPPLPYLLELIWTHIIAIRASEDRKFKNLKKNQSIDVTVSVETIVQELREKFSFALLLPPDLKQKQPKVPDTSWIRRACDELVRIGDAEWTKEANLTVKFTRRANVLEYFIKQCRPSNEQPDLFSGLEE